MAGREGADAERLLEAARQRGTATLARLTAGAVERTRKEGVPLADLDDLFTDAELKELTDSLAATLATADLLGRSRIRVRKEKAEAAQTFADDESPFTRFGDALEPLPPREALAHFRGLVPDLADDPDGFEEMIREQAAAAAEQTEAAVLDRLKAAEAKAEAATFDETDDLLAAAGVGAGDTAYTEMVYRTQTMNAYNAAATQELQDPDVAEAYPVWRYVGIADGRQRASHAAHFDKYFPNATTFEEVRDSIEVSPWNCRCTMIPVFSADWAELYAAGNRVADGYPDVVPPEPVPVPDVPPEPEATLEPATGPEPPADAEPATMVVAPVADSEPPPPPAPTTVLGLVSALAPTVPGGRVPNSDLLRVTGLSKDALYYEVAKLINEGKAKVVYVDQPLTSYPEDIQAGFIPSRRYKTRYFGWVELL